MQDKLIISFVTYNEAEFLVLAEGIPPALTGNVYFPEPWPAIVPSLASITSDVTAYRTLYAAAEGGDRAKIASRKGARLALGKEFKKVATFLELVADGDVAKLATTGFPMRHDIVKGMALMLPSTLADFRVTRAALPGGLSLHAKADPTVDVYTVQIASADPAVEANWTDAGMFKHCNHIELTGLTAGKTYYVRIRGFNRSGHGVWTTSSGIVVL